MRKKTSGLTGEIRIKRCYGCGAILQSTMKDSPGYLPKEKLESESDLLCERCYKLRHYNSDNVSPHFNEDFASILKTAREGNDLVIYVLDIFNLEASLIPDIEKHFGAKLLVILNKRDVLPKSMSDEKLIENASSRLEEMGIKPIDIIVISSLRNYNLDELMDKINHLREGKDVYFIGASQVGKSSIVNSLLKHYKNQTGKFITTSIYPGTTLDVIQIPLDNDSYIYDTPGIFNAQSLLNQVERKILKYIIPRSEINPRVFQSNDSQSYLLGAIARVDFIKGPKTNFNFVFSNELKITRTKLDKADRTFDSLLITKETTPVSETIKDLKDLVRHEFTLPETGPVDILIAGLGFIALNASSQTIAVYAPKNVLVKIVLTRWY